MVDLSSRMKDLGGQRFGRWLVLEYAGRREYYTISGKSSNKPYWLCRCDCGTEKEVSKDGLQQGHSKSCGCLRKEIVSRAPGASESSRVYNSRKRGAAERNLTFNITEEFFIQKSQEDCFYCGRSPEQVSKNPNSNGAWIYNGLDRVDNNRGYEEDNIVACCKHCNWSKKDLSQENFLTQCRRVASRHPERKNINE